jgi:hypothetical protein
MVRDASCIQLCPSIFEESTAFDRGFAKIGKHQFGLCQIQASGVTVPAGFGLKSSGGKFNDNTGAYDA